MPNKRKKGKRIVSVPMEKELREAIEKFAADNKIDRVAAIKQMVRKVLRIPAEKK